MAQHILIYLYTKSLDDNFTKHMSEEHFQGALLPVHNLFGLANIFKWILVHSDMKWKDDVAKLIPPFYFVTVTRF